MSDIIDRRWTCNSSDDEGLTASITGGPVTLVKCPKCNSDAIERLEQKFEGRFEEYQETVGCEECKAQYTVHYSVAFKAVKVTAVSE